MHDFLKRELNLELSEEKTLITNASSQAAKFLGYEIKAQRCNDYIDPKGRRGANGAIALLVPARVIEDKCRSFMRNGKVTHRNTLLHDDDIQDTLGHKDISTTLNIYTDVTKELRRSEFEGLDSYFKNEYNKANEVL